MKLNLTKHKYLSESNAKKIISILTGMMSSVDKVASQCLKEYNPDETYVKGQICLYNNYVWLCKTVTTGAFEETKWEKQSDDITELSIDDIKAMLGLTQDQIDYLAKLISDDTIVLDHTWSSSKSYTEIQQALNQAKQYCLTELAKKSTGSFKIASSTTEVTDGNYLYLIMNAVTSKYDIYALISGNVEKLTTVDVNLDNYLTKTEIENDYLKKTDADSKYATITTVDGKVDKANILSIIQDTDNSKVFGAKTVYDTFKQKADKVNIYEIKQGEKSKHIVIDLPASHSISGKTTRLFVSDNIASIGLQIWNGSTLEKDFRTPLINPLHIFIPSTPLTPVSTKVNFTNGDSSCFYSVINGICYVNIWSMNITSNLSVETIFNDLPRAKVSANFILSNSVGSKTVGMGWISGGSQVIACNAVLEAGTVKSQGYTRFSYPVDETWIPS